MMAEEDITVELSTPNIVDVRAVYAVGTTITAGPLHVVRIPLRVLRIPVRVLPTPAEHGRARPSPKRAATVDTRRVAMITSNS